MIDEDAPEPASSGPGPPVPQEAGSDARGDRDHQPAIADIGATLRDEGESPKRRWRLFRKGGE